MNSTNTDILILGAGIGGFETYRSLASLLVKNNLNKTITLVDQNNYFTFVPMLHEVVSGSIEPNHCTIPLRSIVRAPHNFIRAKINKINPEQKTVDTTEGIISYETCIVALGSGVNYFGVPGAAEHSLNCRTLNGALILRHRLVEMLEGKNEQIKIVMVGGGYTGVEVAGQLAEFAHKYVPRHYHNKKISISIIESAPNILAALPAVVQTKVTTRLKQMGVNILAGKRVKNVTENFVEIDCCDPIPADLTIWTAGIGNVAQNFFPENYCNKGRLPVTEYLTHQIDKNIYAVGDIALFINKTDNSPAPQLGETAHKMGEYVAKHIVTTYQNQPIKPFQFHSRGTLMPIGDWWATAVMGKFIFFGRLAWWIRRTVYIMFMPGLYYKLKIILDWTWHIFGVRDIISLEKKHK